MKVARFTFVVITLFSVLTGPALAARPAQTDAPETLTAFQRLTPDSGWVLMGTRMYWTDNRGQAWRELALPDLGVSVILAATFTDAQQGWLVTHDLTEVSEPRYTLGRTADGAQTWRTSTLHLFEPGDVSALASAAYLQFLDADIGWLLVKRQTSSAFSAGALFKTADGGVTWTRLPQAPLAGEFKFADELNGWVEDQGARYFTRDGGQTWTAPADPKNNFVPPSVPATPSGWNKSASGECDQPGCWQTTQLLHTDDGGQTWALIPLPNAPEGVTTFVPTASITSQDPGALTITFDGHGFDSCTQLSAANMQTWYTNSPYQVWNLYLGGSSLASLCPPLTTAYVSQLSQQGWLFIPTWVGPQAPVGCGSVGQTHMSIDPATAYNQGLIEADLALDRATSLGLTLADQSGGIIHYDVEPYNNLNTPCKSAVNSFISGWTARLRAQGNRVGVYGLACTVDDFATIGNVPDAVWFARWSYSGYTATASVWNEPCFPNTSWANYQRTRQYAGDVNETWGGVSHNIDSDVLSGRVATVLGNCSPNANQVALYVYAQNGGRCVVKGLGDYPDPSALGLPNDSISAVRVGSNVTVTLFQHTFYNGNSETLAVDDKDLSDNAIGDNQVSSAKVQTYTIPVAPQFVFLPVINRYPSYAIAIPNGDFESGRTAWAESSAMTQTLIITASVLPTGTTPHSGGWLAWLGNVDDETAAIQQTLTVPVSAPYLSYWHSIVSDETGCFYDFATLLVNAAPVDTYALCTDLDTHGWAYRTVDLTAYASQTVTVTFQVVTDSSVTSHLFIDDVGFQTGP